MQRGELPSTPMACQAWKHPKVSECSPARVANDKAASYTLRPNVSRLEPVDWIRDKIQAGWMGSGRTGHSPPHPNPIPNRSRSARNLPQGPALVFTLFAIPRLSAQRARRFKHLRPWAARTQASASARPNRVWLWIGPKHQTPNTKHRTPDRSRIAVHRSSSMKSRKKMPATKSTTSRTSKPTSTPSMATCPPAPISAAP